MGWWQAIPAIASAVGGMVGAAKQNEYGQQALGVEKDAYNRALEMLNSGSLEYQAAQQGPSAMAGVRANPEDVMAEREALGGLRAASKEGYNAIDKAAINAMLAETAQQERGSREAALSRLDPGSGQGIAARMMAQSQGANRANQEALNIAAMSRKRALDALGQYGQMSSHMRKQGFAEGAERAKSQDAISRFNTESSNWAKQNSISNRIRGADAVSGAAGKYGAGLRGQGNTEATQIAGMAGMVGQGAAALGASTQGNNGGNTGYTANPDNLTSLSSNPYPTEPDDEWAEF